MPDPYERPKLTPKFSPNKELKLLWFGSQSSFKFFPIVECWQRLEKEIVDYKFTMVSAKTDRVLSKMTQRQNKGQISGINFSKLDMQEWTWEHQGKLLTENLEVSVSFYNENPISIELPNQVKCKIETTDVALKGQTVSSSYKPATLNNGLNIQVPPFIESGDEVIIDTRNLEYVKKI